MAPHRSFLFSPLLVLFPLLSSFFSSGTSDDEIAAMLPCLTTVFNSTDDKKKKHKVGYHFHPNDDELINHYLKKKVQGIDPQELHKAINEVDILDYEPQDLPAISAIQSEDSYWYFFYRLEDGRKRKRGGGGNNRTLNSGKGKWKATGKTRTLRSYKTNQPIGTKKTLVFERPSDKTKAKDKAKDKDKVRAKSQTEWTIHEYYLPSDFPNPEKYVIIKLKRKGKKAVASSPEKGETSQSPEKANETATSSTVYDVDCDNQSAIGFEIRVSENTLVEDGSLSSCMDNTPSQANQEPICNSYDPNHNMDTEQGPSCQERSTSSCGVYNPPWTNPDPNPSYYDPHGQELSCHEWSTSSCVMDNPPADLEASSGCYKPLDNMHPEQSPHCQGFQWSNVSDVDNSLVQKLLTQADLEEIFDYINEDDEEDVTFKKLCKDLHVNESDGLHCSVGSMSSPQSPKFQEQNWQPEQGCDYIPQVTTVDP